MKLRTQLKEVTAIILTGIVISVVFAACGDDDPAGPVPDPLTQGLVGHYSFAGDASDGSAGGNNGILLGGATTNGFLAIGTNDTNALSLPASMADGLGNFTFAGWVRLSTLHTGTSQWISGATSSEDNNLGIWYDPNSNRWSMQLFGGTYNFANNSVSEDGEWHHIVVTRSGGSAALFIDGSAVTTGLTVSADPLEIDNGGLMVGQDQDSLGGGFSSDNSLGGDVDELRIYSRALNAADVAALFGLGR